MTSPGKLIIVPTPIGNLGDMTPRALDALRAADTVCAEDTRVTAKLLNAFAVSAKTERLDENLMGTGAERIISRVAAGEVIAYCSDAGMPGVSDPGLRLVQAARAAGVAVEVLPGASAVTTAYVASGFTCPRFYFGGFFPRKDGERTALLHALAALDAVLVFYESPNRVLDSLRVIAQELPLRNLALARELTKLHEQVLCGTAEELRETLTSAQGTEKDMLRGEMVLAIDTFPEIERHVRAADVRDSAKQRIPELCNQGLSKKDIVAALQQEFGMSRNEAYDLVLGNAI